MHRYPAIQYNHLDLPRIVDGPNGFFKITYDATGRKWLQKTEKKSRIYAGALEFVKTEETGNEYKLEAANTGDGRLILDEKANDGTGQIYPEYHHKDHLGNTRVAFTDRNENGRVELLGADAEVTQQLDYYPFGLQHEGEGLFHEPGAPVNRMQYNGKEMIDGIGLIDYGARWYDPAENRWHVVDPLAVEYSSISTYAYVANMPTNAIDPDGRKLILANSRYRSLKNIAYISAYAPGRNLLNSLIKSDHNYRITVTSWSANSHYYDKSKFNFFRMSTIPVRSILAVGSSWYSSLEGGSRKSQYILYHELGHAYQHELGQRVWNKKEMESSNVPRVNDMRAAFGESRMRGSYASEGLLFTNDPSAYNKSGVKISDFEELDYVNTSGGQVFGFSYNITNENGETEKRYSAVTANAAGDVEISRGAKFNNREAYNLFIDLWRNWKKNE